MRTSLFSAFSQKTGFGTLPPKPQATAWRNWEEAQERILAVHRPGEPIDASPFCFSGVRRRDHASDVLRIERDGCRRPRGEGS
jgi:hypothetical protein